MFSFVFWARSATLSKNTMAHTEAAQSGSCAGDIYILIHNGMSSSVWFSVSLHFAYIRAFFLCVWMPCSIEPCSLRSVVGSSGVEWNRPSLAAHGAICVECQCAVCYDGRTSNCCRRIVAEQTEDGATMQIQLKCPMVKRQKPGCWTRCAQALHHRIEFPVHAKYTTHTRARVVMTKITGDTRLQLWEQMSL